MTLPYPSAILCAYCSNPIRLPVPKRAGTSQHRPLSPRGGWPKNVLCLRCKHVCAYIADTLRPDLLRDTGHQTPPRKDQIVLCAEFRCGEQGCESPVRILAAMDVGRDMMREAARTD